MRVMKSVDVARKRLNQRSFVQSVECFLVELFSEMGNCQIETNFLEQKIKGKRSFESVNQQLSVEKIKSTLMDFDV